MTLKKCKECGNEVNINLNSCTNCGAVIKEQSGCLKPLFFWIFVIVIFSGIAQKSLENERERTKMKEKAEQLTKTIELKKKKTKEKAQEMTKIQALAIDTISKKNSSKSKTSFEASKNNQVKKALPVAIPEDVKYSVIDSQIIPGVKRSFDIRLNRKVSKDILQAIALKIKNNDQKKYARTFILYYLAGMLKDAGAWASSHFNPNLEVKILGITIEEEKALLNEPKISSGEIIGEWLDESPYVGAKYTLQKKNGKIFMIRKFKDGSSLENEMIKKNHSGRLRFEEKGGNDFGEYYIIEKNGNLGAYDSIGFITTIHSVNLMGLNVSAKKQKILVQDFCYALQAAMLCDNLKMRVDTESKIQKKVGGTFRGPGKPYNNDCLAGLMKAFDDENKGLCKVVWEKYGCYGTDEPRLIQENHFRIKNAEICEYR